MKVRVINEFNDKYTGELHKVGSELDITVDRINEIIKVGNFIELLPETEHPVQSEPQTEQDETEKEDQGQDAGEDTPKQIGRRKRSSK